MKLVIHGDAEKSIFSIRSDEFCRRQTTLLTKICGEDALLIMRSDIVATDTLLTWLSQAEPTIITSNTGDVLLAFGRKTDEKRLLDAFEGSSSSHITTYISGKSSFFARKLRRREPIDVYDLRRDKARKVEKALFDLSYKGITDCVTKYVFPRPTWYMVQLLSRFGITPNVVTIIGIILCVLATGLFYQGPLVLAFVFAWIMTFLDTVDGKLARVTATSSEIGNILDHGTDLIHPPFWWIFIGLGILKLDANAEQQYVLMALAALLITYFVGTITEKFFKKLFGFNPYMWRPFDKYLRLFIARRNTTLAILTIGFISGFYAQSYYVAAIWALVSIGIQLLRFASAVLKSRKGEEITIFLREEDTA